MNYWNSVLKNAMVPHFQKYRGIFSYHLTAVWQKKNTHDLTSLILAFTKKEKKKNILKMTHMSWPKLNAIIPQDSYAPQGRYLVDVMTQKILTFCSFVLQLSVKIFYIVKVHPLLWKWPYACKILACLSIFCSQYLYSSHSLWFKMYSVTTPVCPTIPF